MNLTTIIILVLIGLMAGVFGGMFGVGGAIIIAMAFMVGGYFGSKIAMVLPENIMKKVFGILLILVALKMIFSKQTGAID
jgi:uncharacterized membrane protein YfcA